MNDNIFIYAIVHPIKKQVVYIGKTTVGKKRFKMHLWDIKKPNRPIKCFIAKYVNIGIHPLFEILEYVAGEEIDEREKYWISFYKQSGLSLLNLTDGGDGPKGKVVSSATRKKISESAKGRVVSKETRDKLRAFNLGNPAWNKGKKMPVGMAEKISKLKKGISNKKLAKRVEFKGVVYCSLRDASNQLGVPAPTICYKIKRGIEYKYI
jgi:group I intron endonuclease